VPHDLPYYIRYSHDRVSRPSVLSQARGKAKKWAGTELIDVTCLFISDGLDLTGAKKMRRFNGKVLGVPAEIKKRQLRLPHSKVFPIEDFSFAMKIVPALYGAGTEWLF
jgi:hypothetical protein